MNRFRNIAEAVASAVEAFESACAKDPSVDVFAFMPTGMDLNVVAELIRVDMELRRKRGRVALLTDYLARCPILVQDPRLLAGVAFEEYRQRRLVGESTDPSEYASCYGIDVSTWPPIIPASARLR